ncbi:MAG: helix-turn-helix domain-containing protein [Tannerella sp.]|jgi:transcriptional regulator with XRE-family HTH domain|nr:helix-turn-helix domain-containing protein [Tannerella sp.]
MTSLRALLAQNIKNRRRALGITQEKLAEKLETSAHYISQIEQKKKFPSPEMLERIATALEIDSPQLFSINSFVYESIKNIQESVVSDIEIAVAEAVETRLSELKKLETHKP